MITNKSFCATAFLFAETAKQLNFKMDDLLKIAVDEALKEHFPHITSLTPQQFQIMKSLFIDQKDTFAILPTGHGKSLPYQIAPSVAKKLVALGPSDDFAIFNSRDVVIVISPLLSIMDVQKITLNAAGIRAYCLHNENVTQSDILNCRFNVIFGSPEAWIKNQTWNKMLHSDAYQERVLLLVADEAHCIPKW